ncbi:MAG: N-glycosylase/DNA lyase [Candidatus Freyarchaeota archaeon]|nr:N-glycosylase/DNA lyase [Candidatus Jordarchaeia archaeon]
MLDKIGELKRGEVGELIRSRIKEFKSLPPEKWFSELCFCILTANSSAQIGIKAQEEIGNGFLTISKDSLARLLRELGHPYYERRAEYIVEARKYSNIYEIISQFRDERQAREWLAKNVKGIGYKEASHFLRNVGYENVAIIDRHVIRAMIRYGLIDKMPKSLTRKKYLELEKVLEKVAKDAGLTLAELDLYLWYMETGKVLK